MSAISDTLDMVDRSAERTLRAREILTPSVRGKLAAYRQAAIDKANAERIAKKRAVAYSWNRPRWKIKLHSLRILLAQIKSRKATHGRI